MKCGGNSRFHELIGKSSFGGSSQGEISTLYQSTEAESYRLNLKEKVSCALVEIEEGFQESPSKDLLILDVADNSEESNQTDTNWEVTFLDGPMGMSISKDHSGRAYISRLVPNGPAESKGLCIGDIIEVVAGKPMTDYDQIMHMIQLMPRPLQLTFVRHVKNSLKSLPPNPTTPVPSPSTPERSVANDSCINSMNSMGMVVPQSIARAVTTSGNNDVCTPPIPPTNRHTSDSGLAAPIHGGSSTSESVRTITFPYH